MVMALIVLVFLLLFSSADALYLPSNASSILSPLPSLDPPPPLSSPSSSSSSSSSSDSFLKDVLNAIAAKQRWDPEGEVRVWEVDEGSVRVGESQRYEFYVRVGRSVLTLKFSDEVESWTRPERGGVGFGPDLMGGGLVEGRKTAVRDLELEGPLELRVGGGDDELSLLLPSMNMTHKGLRRVLVGHGITIKVEGAQEVSLFHPYDIGALLNRSLATDEDRTQFWPFGLSSCAPLLILQVRGAASLVAFRTRNSESYLGTAFLSSNTIELLPEHCYSNGHFKLVPSCSFPNLSSRLALLEKLLRSFLGKNIINQRSTRLLKAKIGASTLIKFRLELERDITENDKVWQKVAAWRTKPAIERIWYEIVARLEEGRGLKQVIARKLTRPLLGVESTAWSNLMSNISFTQFPSIVVPPEALTLDVKW